MSVSEKIRSLAREGLSVSEIATRLGIRYQHTYNVLRSSGILLSSTRRGSGVDGYSRAQTKPSLSADALLEAGFEFSARWIPSIAGDLILDGAVPKRAGVYAFGKDRAILYVSVATMGLAKRLYFYSESPPGQTRRWA